MRLPPLVRMYWPICGMSATFDWTWRANSSSTFWRSARIGSKICDRAGEDFSTRCTFKTLSRPEQGVEIRGRAPGQVAGRRLVHLAQGLDHAGDEGRLVTFSAVRHRGQKGAVGFGEKPIQRHGAGDVAQLGGLRKCQNPGQRDVEAERQPRVPERGRSGETVQDAAQPPLPFCTKN